MNTLKSVPVSNGKDSKAANTPTAATAPKPQEVKNEKVEPLPVAELPKSKPAELPPVEDRILKVNQLFALVEKHETLLETKKKLKSFKLSTDGSRDTLRILDSKGNEFVTSNSSVIGDVLEVLKTSLDKKIVEVEAQIKF